VMPPLPMVSVEPLRVNASASELNARLAMLHGESTMGAGRVLTPNWTMALTTFLAGAVPPQLAPLDQLSSVPKPLQTTWPRAVVERESARTMAPGRLTSERMRCISRIG